MRNNSSKIYPTKQLGEFDQDNQTKDNMESLSPRGEGFRMRGEHTTILPRSIFKG